jgi:predicted nucleic acid-binding protein
MICVVDASVAAKWFVDADWALREVHVEPAVALLQAAAVGTADFLQPPHFLAEVAAVLARLKPQGVRKDIANLADLDTTKAQPTQARAGAIDLATQLNRHLSDTIHHALALAAPGAVLVTAGLRCFDEARHLCQIAWLPDFSTA